MSESGTSFGKKGGEIILSSKLSHAAESCIYSKEYVGPSLDGVWNPTKMNDQRDPSLARSSVTSRVIEIYCCSNHLSISQFVIPVAHEIRKVFRRLGIQKAQGLYRFPTTSSLQGQEGEMASNHRTSFECNSREATVSFRVI